MKKTHIIWGLILILALAVGAMRTTGQAKEDAFGALVGTPGGGINSTSGLAVKIEGNLASISADGVAIFDDEGITLAELAATDVTVLSLDIGVTGYGWDGLGNIAALTVTTEPSSFPEVGLYDIDGAGTTRPDKWAGALRANFSKTTEDQEVADIYLDAMGAASEGTAYNVFYFDSSAQEMHLGVGTQASDPAAVGTYGRMSFAFDYANDSIYWTNSPGTSHSNMDTSWNFRSTGKITGLVGSAVLMGCEGTHTDAATNATVLIDSTQTWSTDVYKDMYVVNKTDNSIGLVISNTASSMTVTALSGGTNDYWSNADEWGVMPGPYQSGMVFYIGQATTIYHPSTAGYAAGYYATSDAVVTVDPYNDGMEIYLDGAGITAGDEIDSNGSAGDSIWIHNADTTTAYTHGNNGPWGDGGAL